MQNHVNLSKSVHFLRNRKIPQKRWNLWQHCCYNKFQVKRLPKGNQIKRKPNLTIRHLNRWPLANKSTRNGQIVAETQHLHLKNSAGYGKFSRNPASRKGSLTLAEIGGCSSTKVEQCWSLKQEIESAKSGLPSFAYFRWNGG